MLDNIGSNVTSYTHGRLTEPVHSMLEIRTRIQKSFKPEYQFPSRCDSIIPYLSVLFGKAHAVKYVDYTAGKKFGPNPGCGF